ncbi:MAG TPA: PIG-L deacetylase family protein [Candidatus Saccharimonadales bacterium]|nr:PIG-L deacetylase family protein [Candidatus Saccharimonadales bacterium]
MAQKPHCQTEVPQVVLGVAAHPDDLDFTAAGTIALWASQGAEVYYLVLTNGNKGSADLSADPKALTELRRIEQRRAAKILGVKEVYFCEYEDGLLEPTVPVKKDIVRYIRRLSPDTVVTMDPSMLYCAERGYININHPDHRAAGQATLDAVFPLARDHLSLPDLYEHERLEPHRVGTVLLTNFNSPNYSVDITATIDKKMQAISAHDSQMPDLPGMLRIVREVAERAGHNTGGRYAESFIRIDVR